MSVSLPATNLPRATGDIFAESAHFWKGRVALYAILRSLGIGRGDSVVVPGYTCVVVPAAVHFAGAQPVFCDVDDQSFNATLAHVQAAAEGHSVKAVVVQHTYGIPADIGPIVRWAQSRGIWVIEDCCHALGSQYRETPESEWQPVGQLADAAFYSSQWSKPFTTGLGGWAWSPQPDLQAQLSTFAEQACRSPGLAETALLTLQMAAHRTFVRPSTFWWLQDAFRRLSRLGVCIGSSDPEEFELRMPGDYAKRMSRIQRWWGMREARRADANIAARKRLKAVYDDAFASLGIAPIPALVYADPVLLRYPVRVADKPRVLAEARRKRIELGDWFDHPLHPAGSNVSLLGWQAGLCPNGERAAADVVNLPMHARIGEQQVDAITRFVRPYVL